MKFFNGLIIGGFISLTILSFMGKSLAEETPQMRALNMRISSEVNTNLQCATFVFDLQDKLATLQAEVRRLTDKYEPKPDKPIEKP